MRDVLNRRYRMYLSVQEVLGAFAAAVSSILHLEQLSTNFIQQLNALRDGISIGVTGTAGITQDKRETRTRLGNVSFAIANAIWTYAEAQNDSILKAAFPLTLTEYHSGKDVDLLGRYQAVIRKAGSLDDALLPYGFGRVEIADATKLLDEFNRKLNSPKNARAANARKLSDFIDEFKTMDELLQRIDRSVNALILTQPAFYQAYAKARTISNYLPKKEGEMPPAQKTTPFVPTALLRDTEGTGSSFTRP